VTSTAALVMLVALGAAAGAGDINEFCGQVLPIDSKVVRCNDPQFTERHLGPLRIMPAIEELDLSGSGVRDLAPLQGLATLRVLNISNTPVTDLGPLHDLDGLQKLVLGNLRVDEDQIRAVVETHPAIELVGVRDDVTFLRPVAVSLTSTLGTNPGDGRRTTNWLSLGLFGARTKRLQGLGVTAGHGYADELTGAQLSLLSSITRKEARGLQFSLVATKAGSLRGVQIAGIVNRTTDEGGARGIQVAGLVNWNRQHPEEGIHPGIQIAGLVNAGGTLHGLDLAGLASWRVNDEVVGLQVAGALCAARRLVGAQISGGIAGANKGVAGFQAAGILAGGQRIRGVSVGGLGNIAGDDIAGVQVAGLASYARDEVVGVQVAGGVTGTEDVTGAQIGAANFATDDMTGAQVGVFNWAGEVEGLQIGIVNMAEQVEGFSLGLFSWITRGDIHLHLYADERAPFNLAAEYGSGRLYSLVTLGLRPLGDRTLWHAGLGLGVRLIRGTFFLDLDLAGGNVRYDLDRLRGRNLYGQLRLVGGVRPSDWFAVFAGASLNLFLSLEGLAPELAFSEVVSAGAGDGRSLGFWAGVVGGVRFGVKVPSADRSGRAP
jgi:hypothetical protein